jgi:hypothetical protein
MPERVAVTDVSFIAAAPALAATGLVGFVSFRVGPLVVDGATIRRTRARGVVVSLPTRRDRYGIDHPIVRARDPATRAELEAGILAALNLQREAAP